jgi:hypothetical protein
MVLQDYELGRLLGCQHDDAGARKHFDLVLSGLVSYFIFVQTFLILSIFNSGRPLEVSGAGRKVSLRRYHHHVKCTQDKGRANIAWR